MTATPPPRTFPQEEFEARAEAARRRMHDQQVDVLLLTTEPDVRWLSGFDTRLWLSPTRPWFLLLPREGEPVAVVPEIGAPVMARTWVRDVRTWPAPVPADDGVTLLAGAIHELAGPTGRLGVPMGPETHLRMPLADWASLRSRVPEVAVVDATAVVAGARMVKSEAEVDRIRHVCGLASDAFDQLPGLVAEGQPLSELFREFRVELLRHGVDDVAYLVGAAAPGGYADVISPPTDTPVAAGDLVMLDTGSVYAGYFCDFDRNLAVGHADDEVHRAYDTLHRAVEAGLAAVRPGARCSDLHAAMAAVVEADGWPVGDVGRFGHGLGSQLTEWPSHTPDDHTVLRPGMVLTLEPSLTVAPGRSMVHEEDLVVREDGPELLTRRAPAELPVV